MLTLRHLYKSFGGITATHDVNLTVARGHIHAIIGPNGAGKTTLIEQISGALKADSGEIIFADQNISERSVAERAQAGLARSFQITSVILPMTLLENVRLAVQSTDGHSFRFWRRVDHEQKLNDQAMAYLHQVGLAGHSQSLAAEISHGEQRQLEMAMALALKPKLLLLDEPMAGMGKDEGAKLIDLLKTLKNTLTIVLVEHDMDAVFSLADQVSVLVDGHIIATDTVTAVRQNPAVQHAYLGQTADD